MKCPNFEQLIDYLDNRLEGAQASRVADHLATGCTDCGEIREWFAQLRDTVSSDDSVAPPAWVFKRAIRIFDTERHSPKLAERIGNAIAALIFDSFARPALAGVRSTETANRQLLYRAEDYGIDLQILPAEQNHADLIGQVLRENDPTFESVAGLTLRFAREGKALLSTVTDERGEFKINGIKQGVYDLQIELPEGSISVAELPVTAS